MSKFYCLFDGRLLQSVPNHDMMKCTECEMTYSGPFLEGMRREYTSRNRTPTHIFYQGEIGGEG